MRRTNSASSPMKSFVDLACGSFGAVMLLAVALIRAAPEQPAGDKVTGRVQVQFKDQYQRPFGGFKLDFFMGNSKVGSAQVNEDGMIVQPLSDTAPDAAVKQTSSLTYRTPDGATVAVQVVWQDGMLRVNLIAGDLLKPVFVKAILSPNGAASRTIITPAQMTSEVYVVAIGNAIHPSIQARGSSNQLSLAALSEPDEEMPSLSVTVQFDPQVDQLEKLVVVKSEGPR